MALWLRLLGVGRLTALFPDFIADELCTRPRRRRQWLRPRRTRIAGTEPRSPYVKAGGRPLNRKRPELR